MKKLLLAICLMMPLLYACKTAEKVTHSYVKEEALRDEKYDKICVLVLSPKEKLKTKIEKQMVRAMQKRDINAVASTDIVENSLGSLKELDKGVLEKILKEANCDALVTISVLDVRNETRYVSKEGSDYVPNFSYIYYNNYQSYYSYRNAEMQSTGGEMVDETTYYFESNLYDVESKDLVWSVQTEGAQPTSLKSWFRGYSHIMVDELQSIGAIK